MNNRPGDSLRISPDRPVAAERFLCLSGFSFLAPFHQILIPLRGALRCGTVARPGCVVLVPADTGKPIRAAPRAELFRFSFGEAFREQVTVRGWGETQLALLGRFDDPQPSVLPIPTPLTVQVEEVATRIMATRHSTALARVRFEELLVLLTSLDEKPSQSPSERMDEVAEYVETHYDERLTLPGLADHCGLSPTYLSRTFRGQFGIPLFEYINGIRIRKACLLLKRSDLSVLEVAFSVGYNNVSFFNRYFRRILGTSPGEYRKHIRE